mmetsp:Transcript_5797/g.14075  ORF Transcript_5797/g.14075 Transcript_5797/m.14075 type:complete len:370 (+) Transcript_5797:3-1112(+)
MASPAAAATAAATPLDAAAKVPSPSRKNVLQPLTTQKVQQQAGGKPVALLSVSPPVVSLKKDRKILINGRCNSQKELQNLSVLCIAGFPPKFVSIPVVLKKVASSNGSLNFSLELELPVDTVGGLVYFLFADTGKQGPYNLSETEGPCKALLSFNEKESEYHVAPLVIIKHHDDVCKELEAFFAAAVKEGDDSGYRGHYCKHAEFLQQLGTLIGIWAQSNVDRSKMVAVDHVYKSVVTTASQEDLSVTLNFLHSKRRLFESQAGAADSSEKEKEEKEEGAPAGQESGGDGEGCKEGAEVEKRGEAAGDGEGQDASETETEEEDGQDLPKPKDKRRRSSEVEQPKNAKKNQNHSPKGSRVTIKTTLNVTM